VTLAIAIFVEMHDLFGVRGSEQVQILGEFHFELSIVSACSRKKKKVSHVNDERNVQSALIRIVNNNNNDDDKLILILKIISRIMMQGGPILGS
jgi:hypothetical protein